MSGNWTDVDTASRKRDRAAGGSGAVYGLGMIGALVYYWRKADGTGARLRSVPRAFVWPAFVVHDLLRHLDA